MRLDKIDQEINNYLSLDYNPNEHFLNKTQIKISIFIWTWFKFLSIPASSEPVERLF